MGSKRRGRFHDVQVGKGRVGNVDARSIDAIRAEKLVAVVGFGFGDGEEGFDGGHGGFVGEGSDFAVGKPN
jgi:hypothetical protein